MLHKTAEPIPLRCKQPAALTITLQARLQLGVAAHVQELQRGQLAQRSRHAREQVASQVQRAERLQPMQWRKQPPDQRCMRQRRRRAARQALCQVHALHRRVSLSQRLIAAMPSMAPLAKEPQVQSTYSWAVVLRQNAAHTRAFNMTSRYHTDNKPAPQSTTSARRHKNIACIAKKGPMSAPAARAWPGASCPPRRSGQCCGRRSHPGVSAAAPSGSSAAPAQAHRHQDCPWTDKLL